MYVPVKASVPRACANADVPPVTRALPENETTSPAVAFAQARPLRAASLIAPFLPVSTAVPVKATHVGLVETPCAAPLNVLAPMPVPRPVAVPLPEAVLPLTEPLPRPVYVAAKRWFVAVANPPVTIVRPASAAAVRRVLTGSRKHLAAGAVQWAVKDSNLQPWD